MPPGLTSKKKKKTYYGPNLYYTQKYLIKKSKVIL